MNYSNRWVLKLFGTDKYQKMTEKYLLSAINRKQCQQPKTFIVKLKCLCSSHFKFVKYGRYFQNQHNNIEPKVCQKLFHYLCFN